MGKLYASEIKNFWKSVKEHPKYKDWLFPDISDAEILKFGSKG